MYGLRINELLNYCAKACNLEKIAKVILFHENIETLFVKRVDDDEVTIVTIHSIFKIEFHISHCTRYHPINITHCKTFFKQKKMFFTS